MTQPAPTASGGPGHTAIAATRARPAAPARADGPEVICNWARFDEIAAEWLNLHTRARGSLFSSGGWIRAMRAASLDDVQPRIVALWRDGRLAAAAPLGITRQPVSKRLPMLRRPTLRLLACRYSGYVDFPHEDAEALEELLDAVLAEARGMIVRLDRIREGPLLERLSERLSAGRRVFVERRFESVTIDATQSWETYLADRPRSFRKNVRKVGKGIAAAGLVRVTSDGGSEQMLDRALAVSSRSWKGATGTGIGANERGRSFVLALRREFAPDRGVLLSVLRDRDEDIALIFCVERNGVMYGLIVEFDERYAAFSPGRWLFTEQIREVLERDCTVYDLMRRTHFTATFADDGYEILSVTAVPAAGIDRLVTEADRLVVALGRRLRASGLLAWRGRKARRADIVSEEEP